RSARASNSRAASPSARLRRRRNAAIAPDNPRTTPTVPVTTREQHGVGERTTAAGLLQIRGQAGACHAGAVRARRRLCKGGTCGVLRSVSPWSGEKLPRGPLEDGLDDGHQPVPGPVDASVLRADLCTFEQKRDLGRGLLGVVQTCRGAHADQAACLVRLVL